MKILITTLVLATPAFAQSPPTIERATLGNVCAAAFGNGVGLQVSSVLQAWAPRQALAADVDLVGARVDTPLGVEAFIVLRNPTSAPIDGWVDLEYTYRSASDDLAWGEQPGVTRQGTAEFPALAPGESRLVVWSDRDRYDQAYDSASGDWSAVVSACTGVGDVPFTVTSTVRVTAIDPAVVVESIELQADIYGLLTLTSELSPSPDATITCAPTGSASLEACGSLDVSVDALVLRATGLPADTWGLIVVGTEAAAVPYGSGTICVGGQRIAGSGAVFTGPTAEAVDLEMPALPALVGTTVHAQGLYRDGAGVGLTHALALPLR
ncbi:MAG: hypothetical protein AAF957_12740 [Planctomycetota bacterium]